MGVILGRGGGPRTKVGLFADASSVTIEEEDSDMLTITRFVSAVAAVALVLAAPPASAAPGGPGGGADTIVSSGRCSGSSSWVMSGRAKNRGILVAIRITGSRQFWRARVLHNDRVVPGGFGGPGRGGYIFRRPTLNLPGVDTYRFDARSRSGETCSGSLTY